MVTEKELALAVNEAWTRQTKEMTIDWLAFEQFIRDVLKMPDEDMDAILKLTYIDDGLAAFTGRGTAPLNVEHMRKNDTIQNP